MKVILPPRHFSFVEAFADALGGAGMLSLETTGQDGGSVLFASSYRGETLAVTAVVVARTSENGVRSA